MLVHALAQTQHIDATWRATADGRVELLGSREPALAELRGQRLLQVADAQGQGALAIDTLALHAASRWLVSDARRAAHARLQRALSDLLAHERVTLVFDDRTRAVVPLRPRGYAHLSPLFWPLAALALGLYMVGITVALARPSARNLMYLLMVLAQAGSLTLIAVNSNFDFGLPAWALSLDPWLRPGVDAVTAAALLSAVALHPRRLPGARWICSAVWFGAAGGFLALGSGAIHHSWWAHQVAVAAVGLTAIALLSWSHRLSSHPYALVLRRAATVATGSWVLLSLGIASAQSQPGIEHAVVVIGPLAWCVYFASLLMLMPFLSSSPIVMRRFAMLATIGILATLLHLVFVMVFGYAQLPAFALALLLASATYAGVREWVLEQLRGRSLFTTERMFERLYRLARAVETEPEKTPALLTSLLCEVFDPRDARLVPGRAGSEARVSGDGSSLLVPVPTLSRADHDEAATVELRHARRGRRLFTADDARLSDRIVGQLQRAVAHDAAVEQGRSEERLRLAQDLHDDIGARLLTLMYKAPSSEMEEYIRHTLQDLKTLTRGLAASSHRLSHASAEWKADLGQRLTAAHLELHWSCEFTEDVHLSMVQWSALTRVLRELVSNVIAHARAQRVEVEIRAVGGRLELEVADDGEGRTPAEWSQGLGLVGVRKRIRQLDGDVAWRELSPRGIACAVRVQGLDVVRGPALAAP
ncbi:MAG: ATP-binding protein [Burkholderiaceae bacterium]